MEQIKGKGGAAGVARCERSATLAAKKEERSNPSSKRRSCGSFAHSRQIREACGRAQAVQALPKIASAAFKDPAAQWPASKTIVLRRILLMSGSRTRKRAASAAVWCAAACEAAPGVTRACLLVGRHERMGVLPASMCSVCFGAARRRRS